MLGWNAAVSARPIHAKRISLLDGRCWSGHRDWDPCRCFSRRFLYFPFYNCELDVMMICPGEQSGDEVERKR